MSDYPPSDDPREPVSPWAEPGSTEPPPPAPAPGDRPSNGDGTSQSPPPPARPSHETIWGPEDPPARPAPPGPPVPPGAPRSWPGAVPPPPGTPPYWAPSKKSAWRTLWPGALLCAIVVIAAVSVVVYARVESDSYPDEWDSRVADLVAFVEGERDLRFEHPVPVDFLSEAEYSDTVRVDAEDLTEEDTASLDRQVSFLRAMGLASGGIDAVEAQNDLADAGTLAYYDVLTERVVVRGTELTVDLRVTLVHELTHVLQDQHFDLEALQADIDTADPEAAADAFTGYQSLVEGDAVRIENAYIQSLSETEFNDYVETYNQGFEEAQDDLGDVPAALQAFGLVPYVLGQPLVSLIAAEGGNGAVDDAFGELPSTGEHMLDPRSYLDDDGPAEPTDLDPPPLPDGVDESTEEGIFNAVDVYVVLAERIDPVVALEAADGWGNGRWVTYEDDDRTCVRFTVDTDSSGDARQLDAALDDWVAAAPAQSDAQVVDEGDSSFVESCDPGDGEVDINDRALDVLQLPALRSQLAYEAVDFGGLDLDVAWDQADCLVQDLGYEDSLAVMTAAAEEDLPADFEDKLLSCQS